MVAAASVENTLEIAKSTREILTLEVLVGNTPELVENTLVALDSVLEQVNTLTEVKNKWVDK